MNMLLRIILCLALTVGPAVYFYVSGKSSVIEEMIDASRRDNAAEFSDHIAWDDLREFMKANIATQKTSLGTLGSSIGPREGKIPAIVDHYVQLRNVALLFHYHEALFKGVREEDFIDSTGFASPYGFYVVLAYPKNVAIRHDMAAAMRERLKVKAVFRPSGLAWKLSELYVPLFMVPEDTHALPDPDTLRK